MPTRTTKASDDDDSVSATPSMARAVDSPFDQGHERPKLVLHLNAAQRRKAERAAKTLYCVQARLQKYWHGLDHLYADELPDSSLLLAKAKAAIAEFNEISHPGEAARRRFEQAKRNFDKFGSLLKCALLDRLEQLEDNMLQRDDVTEAEKAAILRDMCRRL